MKHILAKFLSGTFTHYQIQYKVIDMLIVGVDNIKTVNMYNVIIVNKPDMLL